MIIAPAIDGRCLFALDGSTGKPIWESRVGYPQNDYTITVAPRMAAGKVVIGVSGGDRPTRGFFDAYDAMTGKRAWRFYTVPGDPSKGFENEAMRTAATTWGGDFFKRGGGARFGTASPTMPKRIWFTSAPETPNRACRSSVEPRMSTIFAPVPSWPST
jgi:outer membrane protein assembly factor BamB